MGVEVASSGSVCTVLSALLPCNSMEGMESSIELELWTGKTTGESDPVAEDDWECPCGFVSFAGAIDANAEVSVCPWLCA